jgi:hypothetical protein
MSQLQFLWTDAVHRSISIPPFIEQTRTVHAVASTIIIFLFSSALAQMMYFLNNNYFVFLWWIVVLLGLLLVEWTVQKLKLFIGSRFRPQRQGLFSKKNISFVLFGAILVVGIVYYAEIQRRSMDPYNILGLNLEDAPGKAEIKSAYRKLSLKWHSDKNPDPEAKSIFSMISKAYKILSDDTTRESFELFGNPSYLPSKGVGFLDYNLSRCPRLQRGER